MLVPIYRWAPAWRLHTNLYKFGENVSPHIFQKKNCGDLHLGESICITTFFLFPDSGLYPLNSFDFLFWSILNGVTLKTSNTNRASFTCRVTENKLRTTHVTFRPCLKALNSYPTTLIEIDIYYKDETPKYLFCHVNFICL